MHRHPEYENVAVCKAHIINQAFPNVSPAWTIQRQDVDGFYGASFEADFMAIQYDLKHYLGSAMTDKKLSDLFKPQILLDAKEVDFFLARGDTPRVLREWNLTITEKSHLSF